MARTIAELIDQARRVVQDERTEFQRHSDDKIISYFNNAIADARRQRPDLFLTVSTDNLWGDWPLYTTDDITDETEFPLDLMYFSAFVEYLGGMLGIEDDEYSNDGRAAALLNRFTQKMAMKGA